MAHRAHGTSPFVQDFHRLPEHAIYTEVDPSFLTDPESVEALPAELPDAKNALRLLLGKKSRRHASPELLAQAGRLYGMLHARYIVTGEGMGKMRALFERKAFGECPRLQCNVCVAALTCRAPGCSRSAGRPSPRTTGWRSSARPAATSTSPARPSRPSTPRTLARRSRRCSS